MYWTYRRRSSARAVILLTTCKWRRWSSEIGPKSDEARAPCTFLVGGMSKYQCIQEIKTIVNVVDRSGGCLFVNNSVVDVMAVG